MTDERTNGGRAHALAEDLTGVARERAEQAYEAMQDGLDEGYTFLKRQVQERPLAVAGVALGVGVVLGLILAGGRR